MLICATAVGPVELLEIVDIKESVTYALSIPPIVGAPSIERFLLDGWETTNLGTATVWFSFLSVSMIHKSGLRIAHNKKGCHPDAERSEAEGSAVVLHTSKPANASGLATIHSERKLRVLQGAFTVHLLILEVRKLAWDTR